MSALGPPAPARLASEAPEAAAKGIYAIERSFEAGKKILTTKSYV